MPIDDKTTAADYLVLGTWEAITLLGQAQERCNEAEVADLLAEAESILISVVSEMPALARSAGGTDRGKRLCTVWRNGRPSCAGPGTF